MIVLDTHAWIWWVSEPDRLSADARGTILYAGRVGICPISIWELATKVTRGRLSLDRALRVWVRQALARPEVVLLGPEPGIAIRAAELDRQGFHGDPADRLITATAIVHGAELVTKDRQIRDFPGVRTVW